MAKPKYSKNKFTRRIRQKWGSVTSWAQKNGFNPSTVFQLLHGKNYKGVQGGVGNSIIKALRRDQLLTEREYSLIPLVER